MSQDFFIFHLKEYELIDTYFIPNKVLIIDSSESVQFNSKNFFEPYMVFVFVFVKTFHWFCINWLEYSNFLVDKLSWVENMLCLCALRGWASDGIQYQNPKLSHLTGVKISPISVHLVSLVWSVLVAVCQLCRTGWISWFKFQFKNYT